MHTFGGTLYVGGNDVNGNVASLGVSSDIVVNYNTSDSVTIIPFEGKEFRNIKASDASRKWIIL